MPTFVKAWCPYCRGPMEVSTDRQELVIACPHCGRDLVPKAAVAYRQSVHPDRTKLWSVVAGTTVLLMALLGFVLRHRIKAAFFLVADELGGNLEAVLCLGLGVLLLVWLVVWMLLPVQLYLSLREIRRRTADLEETTLLCARHLSRLSAQRSTAVPVSDPEPPEAEP